MVSNGGGGGGRLSGGQRRECLGRRSLGIGSTAQNEGNSLNIVIFSLANFLGNKTTHRRHFDG